MTGSCLMQYDSKNRNLKFVQQEFFILHKSGSSSPGRATASQAVGSGFESRLPLNVELIFAC